MNRHSSSLPWLSVPILAKDLTFLPSGILRIDRLDHMIDLNRLSKQIFNVFAIFGKLSMGVLVCGLGAEGPKGNSEMSLEYCRWTAKRNL